MTLERIPEPELMTNVDQARAYAGADFGAAHGPIFRALIERLPDFPVAGRVLDVGVGAADIAVRIARQWPRSRIDGIDGAEAMLQQGRERVAREGLDGQVRLYRTTLPDDPLPHPCYDAAVSNSLLHHLHNPLVLWRTLATALAPGAPIFMADLARPANEATVAALVSFVTDGEPAVLQHDFRASLHAAFTPDEVRAQIREAGLALTVERLDDHHVIVWGYR